MRRTIAAAVIALGFAGAVSAADSAHQIEAQGITVEWSVAGSNVL